MSDTANTIRIACPHCKVVLETDACVEVTRVACPECGREFVPQRHNPGAMKVAKPKLKKKRKFGIVQIVAAVLFLFQAKACSDSKSSDHQHRFLTEDGHYRSETVSGLKTFSAIAYGVGMIPGIGPVVWVPAFGVGLGANWWSNAVQKREDERWERSMQWLKEGGIDPNKPFGEYGQ